MMNYEYTEVNRLQSPHKYMYTQYKGKEFLNAYVVDRISFLNEIKKLEPVNYSDPYDQLYAKACAILLEYLKKNIETENIGNAFNFDYSFNERVQSFDRSKLTVLPLVSFNRSDPINSEYLLVSVLDSQVNAGDPLLIEFWLDLLIQKFEVTKKIYEQYPVNLGKGLGRSDTIKIYWILLVCLSLHFSRTKKIKYLNTILKVNDLICSLNISKEVKDLPTNYLALVLSFEMANIKDLSKEIDEVCLDFT